MADTVWIVEMAVAIPGTVGETTLRYATRGFCTRPSETPASTYIDDVVKVPTNVSRTLFSAGTTAGRSRMGYGDVVLNNADGALDGLLAYGFDGRTITIRRGTFGAAYPSGYTTTFVGTMEQPEVSGDTLTIKVRDNQRSLDQPFQPTKYAGNNVAPDGLEGTEADLKGKPKPLCFGAVKNVPAVCVNAQKNIYQISDGPLTSVDAVYDSGVPLGQDTSTWQLSGSPSFGNNPVRACAQGYYGTTRIALLVGDSGKVATSTDGLTWTPDGSAGFGATNLYACAFGELASSALGYVIAGASGTLSTFTAPGTPTSRTSQFGATTIRAVCYSPWLGLWVAVGDSGKISTSPTGSTWTARTSGVATALYGVATSPAGFVAVGASGVLLTSPDGSTWTARTSGFGSSTIYAVTYGSGNWAAVGADDKSGYSVGDSGAGWTVAAVGLGGSYSLFGVTYADGVFLAVGEYNAVVTSRGFGYWDLRTQTVGAAITYYCATQLPQSYWIAGGYDSLLTTGSGYTTSAPAGYASMTALQSDAAAVSAGSYRPYLAGGYIRLGAPPLGQITADVTQGASAANRTAGQLFAAVLQRAGKASGDWSASDVTALDTANSSVLGFWTDEETTYAKVLDQIANSVGAWWGVDRAGVFRIKQFTAPAGTPVATFTADDLLRPLARVTANDDSRGLPTWLTTLRYQRNYTVQTDGVAGAVSSDRRAYLATEYREATVRDTAVLALHRLAPQDIQETLLQVAADATTEATRQQVLRGILRHQYELVVPLDDDTQSLDLGDVIQLTHNRYGLSGGALFRIIGVTPDAGAPLPSVTLRVWGPSDPTSLLRTPALRLAGAGTVS